MHAISFCKKEKKNPGKRKKRPDNCMISVFGGLHKVLLLEQVMEGSCRALLDTGRLLTG